MSVLSFFSTFCTQVNNTEKYVLMKIYIITHYYIIITHYYYVSNE